jgi:tetratricopeptide (TPR) repeat protein
MATKEVMASAPVLVLLYDRALVSGSLHEAWRKHRRIYLGMGATWTLLALLVIRGGGDRNGSMGIGSSITFSAYLPTQFPAIGHYLRLSFWPHPLIFEYGPFRVKSVGSILRYVCVVIPLLGATAVALWRWPAWGFLGAWFFAILAPTSLVPGAVQMISEHRMYLPLAAVLSAAVYTAYALSAPLHRVFGARTAGWALLLGLAAACCLLTRARNPDYANTLSIWTDTVAKRPSNALAHNNLAVALDDTPGHTDEVIAQYLEAIRLRPTYAKAENNLGNVLSEIPGRMPEALAHYERALKINPKYADAHYNLALELEDIPSRMPEALAHFETALKLAPKDADIENAYADALATIPGRIAEAVGHYKAALRIDPDYTEARESLEELKELPK